MLIRKCVSLKWIIPNKYTRYYYKINITREMMETLIKLTYQLKIKLVLFQFVYFSIKDMYYNLIKQNRNVTIFSEQSSKMSNLQKLNHNEQKQKVWHYMIFN